MTPVPIPTASRRRWGKNLTLAFNNQTEHAALRRGFAVFDTAVAECHLRDTGPLGFVPTGFDVFGEMARGYATLQSLLASDIERRRRENTFRLRL